MLRRVIKRMISLLVAMQLILNTIPGWCLTIRAATALDIGVSNLTALYENGTWSSPSAGRRPVRPRRRFLRDVPVIPIQP